MKLTALGLVLAVSSLADLTVATPVASPVDDGMKGYAPGYGYGRIYGNGEGYSFGGGEYGRPVYGKYGGGGYRGGPASWSNGSGGDSPLTATAAIDVPAPYTMGVGGSGEPSAMSRSYY